MLREIPITAQPKAQPGQQQQHEERHVSELSDCAIAQPILRLFAICKTKRDRRKSMLHTKRKTI